MAKNTHNRNETLAIAFLLKGQQVIANYHTQEIAEYSDNPLIEALPAIFSKDQVIEKLAYYPPYNPDDRKLAPHIRKHKIDTVKDMFVPQRQHLEIEDRISCMLRRGYTTRNPIELGYYVKLREQMIDFQANVSNRIPPIGRPMGTTILGPSGVGKSTAIGKLLKCYPQVICHSEYQGRPFILKQLVWLKLECPKDGSLRGLCINFFQAVDNILGTTYEKNYVKSHSIVDTLVPDMARVAALHSLGLFVVDEIQNLSSSKSGGAAEMLNTFVQIENTFELPVVLIGTPKAISILTQEFRHARRVSEQGDIVMPRMKEIAEKENATDPDQVDPEWAEFVRSMFGYNYLEQDIALEDDLLKDNIVRVLYDVSQGIAAVAVTVFTLAQKRAINTEKEKLTVGIIRSVVKDNQNLITPMLESLREGKSQSPLQIDDLKDIQAPKKKK